MTFFNLDLHISVIADIKWIFERLGHTVKNWSISEGTWVFDRTPDRVDVVNRSTWKRIDHRMCDAFYKRYDSELNHYDGFIVTHTPSFAMLYERWNKPIIVVASTRYEYPFSSDCAKWEEFNEFLRRKIDQGIIIPLANNKYDAAYCQHFTKREWHVIPSVCAYTNMHYTGRKEAYLYSSFLKPVALPSRCIDKDVVFGPTLCSRILRRLIGRTFGTGYRWQDLADYRGIIHIPYNASMMSLFEQYTANIPLLFPSFSFLRTLHERHFREGVLSQLSYNQVDGLPSNSLIDAGGNDPNNYVNTSVMMQWITLADFYDQENMPYIAYFDSFDHLGDLVTTYDTETVSQQMQRYNVERKAKVFDSWQEVLQRFV